MSERMRVGLIGAGLMGHGIGKNILEKGYKLTVMAHRNRAPVEDLLKRGAQEAKSPRDVSAASDLVILCVTGSPQVEGAIYGENGILAGLRPGLIVADCTTADPNSTAKVAADVIAKGGRFVDTPLTRTPKEAEAGKLGLMTGGDPAVLAEIRPVLDCFADTIVHCGPVGAAHKVKLINNFIALGVAALVSEGFCTAAKAGVDLKALREIVSAGGANSVMFQRIAASVIDGDDSQLRFVIGNAQKDLRYYTGMAEALSSTSFIAEAVHQTFVLASNMGLKDAFVPKLADALAKLNGTSYKAGG